MGKCIIQIKTYWHREPISIWLFTRFLCLPEEFPAKCWECNILSIYEVLGMIKHFNGNNSIEHLASKYTPTKRSTFFSMTTMINLIHSNKKVQENPLKIDSRVKHFEVLVFSIFLNSNKNKPMQIVFSLGVTIFKDYFLLPSICQLRHGDAKRNFLILIWNDLIF